MGFWDDDPLAGGGFIYDGHEVSNTDPNYEALLDAYLDGRPFESALEEQDEEAMEGVEFGLDEPEYWEAYDEDDYEDDDEW